MCGGLVQPLARQRDRVKPVFEFRWRATVYLSLRGFSIFASAA